LRPVCNAIVGDHDIVNTNQWKLSELVELCGGGIHFRSMTIIIIICILTGVVLGLRLRAPVLFPTIGLALVGTAIVATALGDQIWLAAVRLAVIATTIQIGYLGGLFGRAAFREEVEKWWPIIKAANIKGE
jgi:hypothetical protein